MQSRTVIRSTTIVLGLLLMSVLVLFAVNEYEKNIAFQWEAMVQPHWEGVVPQRPLLLPLASDKTDEIIISPDTEEAEIDAAPPVEKPHAVVEIKNTVEEKKVVEKKHFVEVKKNPPKLASTPELKQKTASAPKRPLRLRVKDDLYYGHTARWEMKKHRVMPDFFAPKPQEQSDVQLGGHLIMEDDENAVSSSKKNQNNEADYLDAIKGAQLNISIKMR